MTEKLKSLFVVAFPGQVIFLSSGLNLLLIKSVGHFSSGKWYLAVPILTGFAFSFIIMTILNKLNKQKVILFIQYTSFLFVLFQFAIAYKEYGYYAECVFFGILLFPFLYTYLLRFKEVIVYFSVLYLCLNIYYLNGVNIFAQTFERPKFQHLNYSSKGNLSLPNIYHFLIDEASFETFQKIFSNSKFENLIEFDVFSNITTSYSFSMGSGYSTFTSKHLLDGDSVTAKFKEAFEEGPTLVSSLKELGYETVKIGNLPNTIKSDFNFRFEEYQYEEEVYKYEAINNIIVFLQLFKSKYTPFFREPFINQFLYPYTIYSEKYGFQKFLEQEERLSSKGRYSLIYLTSPHFPYLMDDNCDHKPVLEYTTYRSSYNCSLKMINQFLARLKELNRFESSLIIVHSDHGKDYGRRLGDLGNRHHPVFLFKRSNQRVGESFNIAGELLDLPKTILSQLDTPLVKEFDGINLYDKRGKKERHFFQLNPFGRWKKGFHYKLDEDMKPAFLGIYRLEE
ncbi:MAG: hypothetical protein CME67_02840 [Halobacteriovoraceae bacterium]|nr:hypothetical protein [Halobacteriovoraceae bacterium]